MSSCVQWAKERLDDFNVLLGRQLGSVKVGGVDWSNCLGKAVENAGMVGEVGLDFANLVGLGLVKERQEDGESENVDLIKRQPEGEQQQQ